MRATLLAAAWAVACLYPSLVVAHNEGLPIEGFRTAVTKKFFFFKAKEQAAIFPTHDPAQDGASLFVRGVGERGGTSGLIRLDSRMWAPLLGEGGEPIGYKYKDDSGSMGGVTRVVFKEGVLKIKGAGKRWPYEPRGGLDSFQVEFRVADELYCAHFGEESGSRVLWNWRGFFKARRGSAPPACGEQVCGNGVVELGEYCDDGNLSETDGCNNDCTLGTCSDEEFASTFDAIQSVIFDSDVYQCTNAACHGSAAVGTGNLDLTSGSAFANLVDADASLGTQKRVLRNEPNESLLYGKLAAKTLGMPDDVGTPMPQSGPALSQQHLQAVYEWIRGGASETGSISGTSTLLASCLPPADPLTVEAPEPPPAGMGVQLVMDPRELLAASESEVCMSSYFDFSAVVPESAKVPCPENLRRRGFCSNDQNGPECQIDGDCSDGAVCRFQNHLNTGDECFAYNRLKLVQDAQSHHTIGLLYAGIYDTTDEGWGSWTYKFRDRSNPLQDQPCDPLEIDATLGYNPHCSGAPIESAICLDYGPADWSGINNLFGSGGFFFTTEAYVDTKFPATVYSVFPVKGLAAWNSHAFNLTTYDSTMAGWMNLEFAPPEDQQNPVQTLADADAIFTQNVPAFETREYCDSVTLRKGTHLSRLFSHTHLRGVLFRAWSPPNLPCRSDCEGPLCFLADISQPLCEGPRPDPPIYYTTSYSDPLQLFFDPPLVYDSDDPADRTWLYCAVYDNGSTPTSPPVKRQSTTPQPPLLFGLLGIGGPCLDDQVVCANEGPMQGTLCAAVDSVCDSAPGAGDGNCDACPAQGGLTSEDEMFILFGDYFCDGECEEEG